MNKKKLIALMLPGFFVLTGLFSCKGTDRWAEYYPQTGRDLWMDSLMREVYLWYGDIPASSSLNYFSAAETFFKSLLSSKDNSYSSIDTIDNSVVLSYGFEYTLYDVSGSDSTYTALISYVVPGSPASEAGMERGEWIMLADGDSLTENTETLLVEGGSRTLLIGKYTIVTDENSDETYYIEPDRNVSLPAARAVTDPAVHTHTILTASNGYKIGYLAYNSFVSGATDDSQEYDDELRTFSQTCSENAINAFVLDLRYNAGGDLSCVQLMADILAPADKLGQTLAYLQYNDKQSAKDSEVTLDSSLLGSGVNLNLSTLYVITSSTTAGAAEMLINCLKPYMTVVIVGRTTKGQYVATEEYTNPAYPWTLYPAVCTVYNSNGAADFSSGFTPDRSINATSYLETYLPLGNPNETLLSAVLELITGSTTSTRTQATPAPLHAAKSHTIKWNGRKGLIINN